MCIKDRAKQQEVFCIFNQCHHLLDTLVCSLAGAYNVNFYLAHMSMDSLGKG